MRLLICLFILIQILPSKAQEATYCVTSLSELTNAIKKKSKPLLYYPEFGKMGLYLTVKFGSSTYYLESKYAKIEYDTKTKALNAVCNETRNCILSGKLTTPKRQPKKHLATLSKASSRELQCYAGYLNQQIRGLKYSSPIAKLNVNKEEPSQKVVKDSRLKTTKEQVKPLTTHEDKILSNLDHEAAFLKFKSSALEDDSNCIRTLSESFIIYEKAVKAYQKGDIAKTRKLFMTTQPLERRAMLFAKKTIQHIKDGRDYAYKHNVRKEEWKKLYNDAQFFLETGSKADHAISQSKLDEMNDENFITYLVARATALQLLAKGAEAMGKALK